MRLLWVLWQIRFLRMRLRREGCGLMGLMLILRVIGRWMICGSLMMFQR